MCLEHLVMIEGEKAIKDRQGYTAGMWPGWDLGPVGVPPELMLFIIPLCCIFKTIIMKPWI